MRTCDECGEIFFDEADVERAAVALADKFPVLFKTRLGQRISEPRAIAQTVLAAIGDVVTE